jgi:signal peptidase I
VNADVDYPVPIKEDPPPSSYDSRRDSAQHKIWVELVSWFWVILAFVAIEAGVAQARVIPSGSMEPTVLVGDHLIVSRVGYDVGIPFTSISEPLWREPKRQQIIVFRAPLADQGYPDFIKRCIGVPGDHIKIVGGKVFVNGTALVEPYVGHSPDYEQYSWENFPQQRVLMQPDFRDRPEWTDELNNAVVNGELVVPPGQYFMMGDNRDDSNDSRYWGFVPRANIIGTPVVIYMSINAKDDDAWQPGHLDARLETYADAVVHPTTVRWRRLFNIF